MVRVAGSGRVGDAPVDSSRVVGELRADFADLVAQRDHVVEPAAGDRVQVSGPLAGDVDAELVPQDPNGAGVQTGFGQAAGAGDVHVRRRVAAQQGLGDR